MAIARSHSGQARNAREDRGVRRDLTYFILERFYATRAHSHLVEVKGASHSVYESHPKEVAALIEEAAQTSQN
jgi:pimeloyl-ACP methyl ester carboxylesterase